MTDSGVQPRVLARRFRLEGVLGRGGMGTVWAGVDELLGRPVAIKEVLPPAGLSEDHQDQVREQALREARGAARIVSDHAVTVFDVIEVEGHPWIVMQRLEPRTLADVIRDEGPLPPERVARIGLHLCDALAAAHAANVLHRDVKPSNVLLTDDGSAVLTDFGIATLDGDATGRGAPLIGSPAYMAPERVRGEPVSAAADVWSLGATLFAALEGHPPYEREQPLPTMLAVLHEPLPPAEHGGPLRPVIERLMTADPAERPDVRTARELLESALATATGAEEASEAAEGTPPGGVPRTAVMLRARRTMLAAAATLLVVAGGTVFLATKPDRAPAADQPVTQQVPVAVPSPTADAARDAAAEAAAIEAALRDETSDLRARLADAQSRAAKAEARARAERERAKDAREAAKDAEKKAEEDKDATPGTGGSGPGSPTGPATPPPTTPAEPEPTEPENSEGPGPGGESGAGTLRVEQAGAGALA